MDNSDKETEDKDGGHAICMSLCPPVGPPPDLRI